MTNVTKCGNGFCRMILVGPSKNGRCNPCGMYWTRNRQERPRSLITRVLRCAECLRPDAPLFLIRVRKSLICHACLLRVKGLVDDTAQLAACVACGKQAKIARAGKGTPYYCQNPPCRNVRDRARRAAVKAEYSLQEMKTWG